MVALGHAHPLGRHHLRLLRRGLLVPRRGPGHGRGHPRGADDPEQGRRRQRGPQLCQGPVRLRVRRPRRPPAAPDGARHDRRRVAPGLLGGGDRQGRRGLHRDPGRARRRRHRRDLLLALHQRGGLRRPEDGAGGVRQQQRRHLRPGLPLPHRLRAEPDVRDLGRHPGLRVRRPGRRRPADRREPDRRPPGLRVAPQAPAARRCPDHRGRPPPDRPGARPARRGGVPPPGAARHQRRLRERDGSRRGHRGPARRGVPARALRERRGLPRVHRPARRTPPSRPRRSPASPPRSCGPRPGSTPRPATARSTTGSASPSTARARPW